MIKYIAIDYGGVFAHHYCQPYISGIASLLNVSILEFKKLVSENSSHGAKYRTNNISMHDFWKEVALLSGNSNIGPEIYGKLQIMWAKTYIPDDNVKKLLSKVRDKFSIPLILATNSDYLRSKYLLTEYRLEEYFDEVLASWKYEVLKPSSAYFDVLLELTNCIESPEEILFIDNNPNAINKAKEMGIQTHLYKSYNVLEKHIISMIGEYQ